MVGFMVVVRIYMYVGLALQLVLGLGDGLRVRFRLALGTGSKYPRWCFWGRCLEADARGTDVLHVLQFDTGR